MRRRGRGGAEEGERRGREGKEEVERGGGEERRGRGRVTFLSMSVASRYLGENNIFYEIAPVKQALYKRDLQKHIACIYVHSNSTIS